MNHASLFTGIGGFDLAAEWMGWNNIFQVELNEFCQTKLIKNFPNAKRYTDIKLFDGKPYTGRIDVLTGGFPCQTFSVAGKGAVDLTLWKEMFRTITEIEPAYVVAENVPGLVSRKNGMAFNVVCSDLENAGYEVQAVNIPIGGKGAPHERERIWFLAYSDRFRCKNEQEKNRQTLCNGKWNGATKEQSGRKFKRRIGKSNSDFAATNTNSQGLQSSVCGELGGVSSQVKTFEGRKLGGAFAAIEQWQEHWYEVATRLCRVDDGIPDRMDRIMALGNAISPVLAYDFFKCIETNISMRAAGC